MFWGFFNCTNVHPLYIHRTDDWHLPAPISSGISHSPGQCTHNALFFWCVPSSFILTTVRHVTVVHFMPGQKKPLATVLCVLCNTEVCWMCWPWRCSVSEAVPVEISCFTTHGHLGLRGWLWSASCNCTKYTLEEKKERLNLHLCLPLISQFATL